MEPDSAEHTAVESHEARSTSTDLRSIAALALIVLFFLGTGWLGVDFGTHWDEHLLLGALVRDGGVSLIPGWYAYPSLCYDLCLLALGPAAWGQIDADTLEQIVFGKAFTLRARLLFLLVSSAGIVWTYLLVVHWRGSRAEALIAAAALGLSWELGYHSRWIAPDALVVQFTALTTLLCMLAVRGTHGRWELPAAAAAAGLATGTKYPAGILLLQVFAVIRYRASQASEPKRAGEHPLQSTLLVGLVFAAAFLLTTTGALFEPAKFFGDIAHEVQHYSAAGHRGYTTDSSAEHLGLATIYLSTQFFSPMAILSVVFFALALLGCWRLAVESPRSFLLLMLAPGLYLLYFSLQRALIVRNLLLLSPYLAVTLGIGTVWLRGQLAKTTAKRRLFDVVLIGAFLANAVWITHAAVSIRSYDRSVQLESAADFIRTHTDTRFSLSPKLRKALARRAPALDNVTAPASAERSLAWTSELRSAEQPWPPLPANWPGRYVVFGPLDVNFDYYPDWEGRDRIVVMPAETMRRLRKGLR